MSLYHDHIILLLADGSNKILLVMLIRTYNFASGAIIGGESFGGFFYADREKKKKTAKIAKKYYPQIFSAMRYMVFRILKDPL